MQTSCSDLLTWFSRRAWRAPCGGAGRAGEECEKADGRELWVLAEMYNIAGVREWLQGESLDVGNFCAACEFGLLPEGTAGS